MATYECPKADRLVVSRAGFMRDLLSGRIRATSLHETALTSGRTRIDYEDPDEPVSVFNVGKYFGDWQAALTDALAANGVLELPPGTITSSSPMVIDRKVKVRGFGKDSRFSYTGSGAAIRIELDAAQETEGVALRDFRISGTNAEGQGGVEAGVTGSAPRTCLIQRLQVDGFNNGIGVHTKNLTTGRVEFNKIQGTREGVVMRTPCGSAVHHNWINYWADSAIRWWSPGGDGLAARNSDSSLNIIHGSPVIAQAVMADRAAIRVDGVSNLRICNEYLEDLAKPDAEEDFVCHAIWLQKTGTSLTQGNAIRDCFFSANGITGDAIRLDSGVTHSTVGRNQLSLYVIRDSAAFTNFEMQHMSDQSLQLLGTGTSRRGTISLPGSVVTLHA